MLWVVLGWVAGPAWAQARAERHEVVVEAAWTWPSGEGLERASEEGTEAILAAFAWWLEVAVPEIDGPLPLSGRIGCTLESEVPRWSMDSIETGGLSHERATLHRSALPPTDGQRVVVAEVMLDLNALRRGDPDSAAYGGPARAMEYWRISNARELMLHVRAAPRPAPLPLVLEVDLTWSSRSEPPESIRTMRLSQPIGPVESATVTPAGSAWTVSFPLKLRFVIARALGSAIAARHGDDEFQRQSLRWATAVRDRVTRLEAVLEDRVVLSGHARGVSARIGLVRQRGGRSVAADMAGLQARLRGGATADNLRGGVQLTLDDSLQWEVKEDDSGSWLGLELGELPPGR